MAKIPLLIIGDDPALQTGLARIARDLCKVILKSSALCEQVDLAVLGCGADADQDFAVEEGLIKVFRMSPPYESCGETDMERLERVFFRGRKPIIWPTWDATRSLWIRRPGLTCFKTRPTAWGYFPFDSVGPFNLQPRCVINYLKDFDRIAVPSKFAADSLGNLPCRVFPHGYYKESFNPKESKLGREMLKVPERVKHIVGVVATNQSRKDWGMVFQVCAMLLDSRKDLHFWFHTDSLDRCWNFMFFLHEFNLVNHVTVTPKSPDEAMANMYSACSVTIAPGLGEGFGYPILESIACGTPVVHGAYGAGAEIINNSGLGKIVYPEAMRWEATSFPVQRPVYSAKDWKTKILQAIEMKGRTPYTKDYMWENLGRHWEAWIQEGIDKHNGKSGSGIALLNRDTVRQ